MMPTNQAHRLAYSKAYNEAKASGKSKAEAQAIGRAAQYYFRKANQDSDMVQINFNDYSEADFKLAGETIEFLQKNPNWDYRSTLKPKTPTGSLLIPMTASMQNYTSEYVPVPKTQKSEDWSLAQAIRKPLQALGNLLNGNAHYVRDPLQKGGDVLNENPDIALLLHPLEAHNALKSLIKSGIEGTSANSTTLGMREYGEYLNDHPEEGYSLMVDSMPVIGFIKAFQEFGTGYYFVAGRYVSSEEMYGSGLMVFGSLQFSSSSRTVTSMVSQLEDIADTSPMCNTRSAMSGVDDNSMIYRSM